MILCGYLNMTPLLFRTVLFRLLTPCQRQQNVIANYSLSVFQPEKVLILTKISRYEYERRIHPSLIEEELKSHLTARGSDYDMLLCRHNVHKKIEESVVKAFEANGIQTRLVNRLEYTDFDIRWADLVVSTGGDGTFLLAASRINTLNKPVIGFNSDPGKSKGHLCLPKEYSFNPALAVERLLKGVFQWLYRSRIRITLIGKEAFAQPIELHDQQLKIRENRYLDFDVHLRNSLPLDVAYYDIGMDARTLPVLALNEVFMGENISARVSYVEIKIDENLPVKQKCSGLIVSTGTGSTSWAFNVNKLTEQSMEQVLNILREWTSVDINKKSTANASFAKQVSDKFNELLLSDPEDNRLLYTIRDQHIPKVTSKVSSQSCDLPGVSSTPAAAPPSNSIISSNLVRPRGFARKLYVRSRCFDASLVIDGGVSFPFNDGMRAIFEIHPQDALKTVMMSEPSSFVTYKH